MEDITNSIGLTILPTRKSQCMEVIPSYIYVEKFKYCLGCMSVTRTPLLGTLE
jgi:hypothetical protein